MTEIKKAGRTDKVRVAGFAAYFIDPDRNLQDPIIARTLLRLGAA